MGADGPPAVFGGNITPIPTQATLLQLLRNVPLFRHAGDEDLALLAAKARRVRARRKEVLYRQGDPCDGFHVVVYGQIKMSLLSWQGADKPIQLIGQGGCFGDITMLNGEGYFLNVQALEDSLFLYLPRDAIVQLIERNSAFAMAMLRSLSSRVKGIVDDIEAYSLQPPTLRLVRYLLRLVPGDGAKTAQIRLSIRKNVVAGHLSLTPETLSRCFKELIAARLVAVEGSSVLVHDVAQLTAFLSAARSGKF
ncbi:hypothetical protein RD110_16715 [Rhodoferax koreense]|uniref:Crp/Fnr family transcriptional regulator n=2 Tax=Rhodoferax koreensis TaxID=1842727 RepID=A0A1P8K408_9BURK|nr:hypothetical protein RD110_16715 [Rhodoferax koreense]